MEKGWGHAYLTKLFSSNIIDQRNETNSIDNYFAPWIQRNGPFEHEARTNAHNRNIVHVYCSKVFVRWLKERAVPWLVEFVAVVFAVVFCHLLRVGESGSAEVSRLILWDCMKSYGWYFKTAWSLTVDTSRLHEVLRLILQDCMKSEGWYFKTAWYEKWDSWYPGDCLQ